MMIEIESRESITARARKPFPAHNALISVTDTDGDYVALDNKPDYLLQMRFDDVDNEIFEEILGRKPNVAEALKLAGKFHMINDKQAKEIASFVKSALRKADALICQCEYGQSRSAGIAATVKQFLFGDGIEIFAEDRYYPNKLVYRKVLAAIKTEEDTE